MALSSIEIRNKVKDLDNKISQAEAEFNAAEGDAKDAFRDQIMSYKGEQKSLNEMLDDVLDEEDKIRKGGGVPLAYREESKWTPASVADKILGDPNDFKPMVKNEWRKYEVTNTAPDYGLPRREEVSYDLPSQLSTALPVTGFLDSLPKATTSGDIKYFVAAGVTNNADFWDPGNLKASSSMDYEEAVAMLDTIAHGMPVLEENLADYGQLRAQIDTELLAGLRIKEGWAALNANRTSKGMVGILNNENIQKFTKKSNDTIPDAIRKMKTDSFIGSKFSPTHIAVHPYVTEALELEKDANGRYMNVMVNGRLWALSVVEDMNLKDSSDKYGAIVYWNGAATWFTRASDSLAIGVVDDQFMRNELTIRAEGRHALKVTYPKSFVYLADTGVTRA